MNVKIISFIKSFSTELPTLLYGQTLEVLVDYSAVDASKEPFQVFLQSDIFHKHLEVSPQYVDPMDAEDAFFARAQVRSEIIQSIRKAGSCSTATELDASRTIVADAKKRVADLAERNGSPEVAKMKEDIDGQISEAYSRLDWHRRWGAHYILALASAHSLHQCTNFKDPGLETYATAKFSKIRDGSEAKFVDLPPPRPSREVRRAVSTMRTYYCSSNPCFASGLVHLADGTQKSIRVVKKGDMLQSTNGPVRVRCVVETPVVNRTAGLVSLSDNVTVTPWHPVRPFGGEKAWKFPHELNAPQYLPCETVISLVLDDGATSFRIGDFEAVALGHGIVGDPVASHEYLGTKRILKDLAEMEGWITGYVLLPCNPVIRDQTTSLIVGLKSCSTAHPDSVAAA